MYTRSAGTLAFAAPERFLDNNIGYTNKVDIWSSGIILFMLLIGYHPFDHFGSIANLIKQILNGQQIIQNLLDKQPDISTNAKNLIL